MAVRTLKLNMKVRLQSDVWVIHGIGISKANKTICDLVSTTSFKKQKNGDYPRQLHTWVKGLPESPEFIEPEQW
jgi:hypothetical protein